MQLPGSEIDRVRFGRATISKWQIKVLLTVIGLSIMAAVLLYTKTIVDELVRNESRTVELYANLLARSAQEANDQDLLFYLDIASTSITFPVVITDRNEQPIFPFEQFLLNVDLDSTLSIEQQRSWMIDLIADMRRDYPPFEITDPSGKVIQKMFFTNSAIVRRLRFMPYVEILIVTAFIIIGYVAFSTIRKNEESNIWVGMAKEAAHQLGTPLSSLLAWLEILRSNAADPTLVEKTSGEMEQDVHRLNVIANRFSKIGSQPQLVDASISEVIERVCLYFETRLPNLGRKVVIERKLDHTVRANISAELFEWVFENLIRNAVEAIERQDGVIKIQMSKNPRSGISILVSDNGKGMTAAVRKRVFQPGFTTKRRGWGLGMSLSKRIVEEYHGGKLNVKDSQVGVGTTFILELP
ncbi:MAG: HAMP domain-containing histidine kinase [Ignavibacteria bacterium]|nr:HAMP domain-containing histidine kinase [Ignavibacteria bacterium]